MSNSWYNLGWLLPAPDDFNTCVRKDDLSATDIRGLANHKLNDRQARKLGKAAKSAFANDAVAKAFQPVSVVFLTDSNLEFAEDQMFATGLRFGLNLSMSLVEYTDMVAQATNPDSPLYASKPDFVVLANFGALLYTLRVDFKTDKAGEAVDSMLAEASIVTASVAQNSNAQMLVQTVPSTHPTLFGNLDAFQPGTFASHMGRLNSGLSDLGFPMLDIAQLANSVGRYDWFSDGQYHWTKTPFAPDMAGLYCDRVVRYLAAAKGKGKKVLVLDLDNTLWGGVIGDDGVEGIKLGNNSAPGEAFLAGQRYYKMLADRGVVLAVCSKNDMHNGLAPFQDHPDMILTEEDISCFVANWEPKPSNIRYIAEALNLGTDSFVFLDDNPAERGFVRLELPEVAVPEVPDKDASFYPRFIEAAGYFEATSFTETDIKRVDDYKANAKRAEVYKGASDINAYLKSLDMQFAFGPFADVDKDRISQLINRSNQFNLTTRRYTVAEVEGMMADPKCHGFTAKLSDKFSDSGLVVVTIARDVEEKTWEIDTWLMSCRVLGRKAEEATLYAVIKAAQDAGVTRILGRYIPSVKNGMVKEHYAKLGFTKASEDAGGESVWELVLSEISAQSMGELAALPMNYI